MQRWAAGREPVRGGLSLRDLWQHGGSGSTHQTIEEHRALTDVLLFVPMCVLIFAPNATGMGLALRRRAGGALGQQGAIAFPGDAASCNVGHTRGLTGRGFESDEVLHSAARRDSVSLRKARRVQLRVQSDASAGDTAGRAVRCAPRLGRKATFGCPPPFLPPLIPGRCRSKERARACHDLSSCLCLGAKSFAAVACAPGGWEGSIIPCKMILIE